MPARAPRHLPGRCPRRPDWERGITAHQPDQDREDDEAALETVYGVAELSHELVDTPEPYSPVDREPG